MNEHTENVLGGSLVIGAYVFLMVLLVLILGWHPITEFVYRITGK